MDVIGGVGIKTCTPIRMSDSDYTPNGHVEIKGSSRMACLIQTSMIHWTLLQEVGNPRLHTDNRKRHIRTFFVSRRVVTDERIDVTMCSVLMQTHTNNSKSTLCVVVTVTPESTDHDGRLSKPRCKAKKLAQSGGCETRPADSGRPETCSRATRILRQTCSQDDGPRNLASFLCVSFRRCVQSQGGRRCAPFLGVGPFGLTWLAETQSSPVIRPCHNPKNTWFSEVYDLRYDDFWFSWSAGDLAACNASLNLSHPSSFSVCELRTNIALNLSHPSFFQFVISAQVSTHCRQTVSFEVPSESIALNIHPDFRCFFEGHDPVTHAPQGQMPSTCWTHLQ